MEVKHEPDSDAKWGNYSLCNLPEISGYLKENQSPNSKKPKEKSNVSNKLAAISTDFSEVLYESFHIKIPANLASIDYVMKSLSHHRRTRSINDLSNRFMNSSLSSYSREIDRCTSERWVFESREKPMVSRKLAKYPSYFSKFSPELGSKSTGILSTKWKDGLLTFEFSIGGEFYIATPIKMNNLSARGQDYIYLFHKGVFRKKGLEFVGMMKVSNSLVLNSNGCNYVETEFVVFSNNPQCEFSNPKNRGLIAKKALNILRPNYLFNNSKTVKRGKISESSVLDESVFVDYLSCDFPPNFESCAIVVRNYKYGNKKNSVFGGWGLKFLQKEEIGENFEEKNVKTEGKFGMELNVLIPSGVHGSPNTESGVPSSLIERWKSDGLCDCGGWDLGCPINVISNNNNDNNNNQNVQTQEPDLINLFVKGSKDGESVFRLVRSNEGVNFVHFKPNLSALQCLFVGVAFVHAQTPDLSPNL
ncbi:hypothetical protein LUZ60_016291 [Juncus effusus]|nr:hypothetical protein LUZ60_016291 [Juncus effusus]